MPSQSGFRKSLTRTEQGQEHESQARDHTSQSAYLDIVDFTDLGRSKAGGTLFTVKQRCLWGAAVRTGYTANMTAPAVLSVWCISHIAGSDFKTKRRIGGYSQTAMESCFWWTRQLPTAAPPQGQWNEDQMRKLHASVHPAYCVWTGRYDVSFSHLG